MAMATRRVVPVSSPPQARREYWRALVDAHRRSGLSQAAFCRRRGIPTGTLSFWKWKLAREAGARRPADGPARPAGPPTFVPIQIAASPPPRVGVEARAAPVWDGEVEIALDRGPLVRVRGRVDEAGLALVLRAVEALGC